MHNSSSNVKINSIHSSNKILLQCAVHRLCHMYTVHCAFVKYLWCEYTCVLCTLVHSVQYTVCIRLQRLQCAYCSAEWVALHRGGRREGVGGVTGVQAASSGHSTSPASTLSVTPYTPHHHLHKTSKPKINQRLQKRSGRYLQLFNIFSFFNLKNVQDLMRLRNSFLLNYTFDWDWEIVYQQTLCCWQWKPTPLPHLLLLSTSK